MKSRAIILFFIIVVIGALSVLAGKIIYDWKYIHKKNGTIVLLNGTSSSGKTSIIKDLQKTYGNSYLTLIGDDFVETYAIEHPMPISMSRDVYQKQVLSALFVDAKKLSLEGKNVLVDVVDFDNYYEYYCSILGCNKVVKVLVYCPLDVIVDRVEKRNKSGNPKEERPLNLSFGQFSNIYKLQQSVDEVVVDRIQTSRIKAALQVSGQEVMRLMKEAGVKQEDLEGNLQLYVDHFAEPFKLDTYKEIVLVPKHSWDLIVNSGAHSSQEIAHEIVKYLKNRTL